MLKKIATKLNDNFLEVFIVFLLVINILPILAPLFAHWGWKGPSLFIYNIYSFFCHQFAWRSIHIYDYQCAWCARDMFIWGAILFVAVLVKFRKIKGIKWYWLIPFTIPIALDGGIQTVATLFGFTDAKPLYMSNNLLRMLTGSIFGIGLGLWMAPTIKEITEIKPKNAETGKTTKN